MACLNHGFNVGIAGYLQDPAARARWHADLSPSQKEIVLIVWGADPEAMWQHYVVLKFPTGYFGKFEAWISVVATEPGTK